MPYQQNIPRPTDQLNNSQGDIQGNFLEIYNWVAINHEQFDTANAGKHTQVTLPINPAPTPTAIGEANIYSRTSTLTTNTELTWQRDSNGAVIEWTGLLANQNGWTRLPSGILMKWGFANSTGTGFTLNYPVAATIPVFVGFPYIVQVTPYSGSATGITVTVNNAAFFTVNTFQTNLATPSASPFYYLAIGI